MHVLIACAAVPHSASHMWPRMHVFFMRLSRHSYTKNEPPWPKRSIERRVSKFCTICPKNQAYRQKHWEKVMANLVRRCLDVVREIELCGKGSIRLFQYKIRKTGIQICMADCMVKFLSFGFPHNFAQNCCYDPKIRNTDASWHQLRSALKFRVQTNFLIKKTMTILVRTVFAEQHLHGLGRARASLSDSVCMENHDEI